jgi:hypothetical protein
VTAPKCKCSHIRHVGRCPSLSCGCKTYRPVTDLAACVERHPAGKALPQTADIFDYLRQKGEIQ